MNRLHALGRWWGRRSAFQIGVAFLVLFVVGLGAGFNRSRLQLAASGGETIAADFPVDYKLQKYETRVKLAGVRVGQVSRIEQRPDGTARVHMKVEKGTLAKLGSNPTAAVRPTTVFSGPGLAQYVELRPGGERGGKPPDVLALSGNRLPVEIDQLLEALTDPARQGLSGTLTGLDGALAGDGAPALGDFLAAAPPALQPAGPALAGLAGEHDGDLNRLVADLGKAAAALTANDGELESVVDDLATVASRLAARTPELSAVIDQLPATLTETRSGLTALAGTLTRLQNAAPAGRRAAAQLRPLLERAGPVLAAARPVLADLRPLVTDLRPLLDDLGPTANLAENVLAGLDDPVLGRLNNDVIPALRAPYQGSDNVLYQETAYLLAGLGNVVSYVNSGGALLGFDRTGVTLDAGP